MEDELTGDGIMLILDGESTATVYYWLTVVPEPGSRYCRGFSYRIRRFDETVQESDCC
jgi:hypothetical protein